ncbi:Hypothetical protein Minf_0655 [Methylacidiphilum infernorum V4]|uniref:Uncharacterized protein n=1 Tax=Methylacidiphilum infernorum (isolate V4) TaxID=481448 RepID=B3E049_METI4|nr:Hypothetical protein Minf_0655 [Methylacidiphilum infernorum V4]
MVFSLFSFSWSLRGELLIVLNKGNNPFAFCLQRLLIDFFHLDIMEKEYFFKKNGSSQV